MPARRSDLDIDGGRVVGGNGFAVLSTDYHRILHYLRCHRLHVDIYPQAYGQKHSKKYGATVLS
jgi:hypothetical protein